jgi:putative transposase
MDRCYSSIDATAFPPEIISHAVWLHHRSSQSFREVEDLLAERGISIS